MTSQRPGSIKVIEKAPMLLPYPRPYMLNLSTDDRVHRVLVPVPVLTATINDSTGGAFNHIPAQAKTSHLQPVQNSRATPTLLVHPFWKLVRAIHPYLNIYSKLYTIP